MRKTKLFFVACWALMLAMQAHAKTIDGDDSVREAQYKCFQKAAPNEALTADQLRARLVDALLSCGMYSNYKNAVQFVESLSDQEVQALLVPTTDKNLFKMTDYGQAIRPIKPTPL